MLRDKHPFFICRYSKGEHHMQYVHAYNPNTKTVEIMAQEDDKILYFATDDLAVEAFNLIKHNLPDKDEEYPTKWFIKESVRSIKFAIERKRVVIGYTPKKDYLKLTTKSGTTYEYVYDDLTDTELFDLMYRKVLEGCGMYGILPSQILSIETVQ